MALEDSDIIDMEISVSDRKNGIDLLLFDHGVTTDESERYTLLSRKLGTYVGHVMSKEFRSEQPRTRPTGVFIRVVCRNPPNSAMQTIQAVFPKGDRVNRIAVVFEDADGLMDRLKAKAALKPVAEKKRWWQFR